MKVFDVTIDKWVDNRIAPISVYAEDVAQAVRIAVRFANKARKSDEECVIAEHMHGRVYIKPPLEITAEDVAKVEVVRNQVAS